MKMTAYFSFSFKQKREIHAAFNQVPLNQGHERRGNVKVVSFISKLLDNELLFIFSN